MNLTAQTSDIGASRFLDPAEVGFTAPLFIRHGQCPLQLLNGSVQRLCMGLATGDLHEGRMP